MELPSTERTLSPGRRPAVWAGPGMEVDSSRLRVLATYPMVVVWSSAVEGRPIIQSKEARIKAVMRLNTAPMTATIILSV